MRLIYRPNHPQADKQGFVDRDLLTYGPTRPCIHVISDTMEPTRHMATGKWHTSKAAFRADTKASGCIEYGNDASLMRPRKPVTLSPEKRRDDIRKAIHDLRNGRRP